MIGFILGLLLVGNFIGIAWSGIAIEISMFAILIIIGVGIFLFPRTIGTSFTPMVIVTPFLFVISWARHGLNYSFQVLLLGVTAWLVTFLVSLIRRDAV